MTITDTRQVDHDTAERLAGRRLDRRRRYAVIDGAVCVRVSWAESCSGCYIRNGITLGCHECGYCGIRRVTAWLPFDDPCPTPTATAAPATAADTPSTASLPSATPPTTPATTTSPPTTTQPSAPPG